MFLLDYNMQDALNLDTIKNLLHAYQTIATFNLNKSFIPLASF